MSFVVEVHFMKNGQPGTEVYRDRVMMSCIGRTFRKHGGRNAITITGTTSRPMTRADKCIPDPPEGWEFDTFRIKQRKNRFGRLINEKPDD
jgi:hypothetical protein